LFLPTSQSGIPDYYSFKKKTIFVPGMISDMDQFFIMDLFSSGNVVLLCGIKQKTEPFAIPGCLGKYCRDCMVLTSPLMHESTLFPNAIKFLEHELQINALCL